MNNICKYAASLYQSRLAIIIFGIIAEEDSTFRRRYSYVVDWRVCRLYIVIHIVVEEGETIATA